MTSMVMESQVAMVRRHSCSYAIQNNEAPCFIQDVACIKIYDRLGYVNNHNGQLFSSGKTVGIPSSNDKPIQSLEQVGPTMWIRTAHVHRNKNEDFFSFTYKTFSSIITKGNMSEIPFD